MAPEYIGLLGTVLGAGIVASISVLLNWQNVKSEDRQWMRNTRQEIYKEFLSAGTLLHQACEQVAESNEPNMVRLLATPAANFDEAYIALQLVSDRAVFLAARKYNYSFPDLIEAARSANDAKSKEMSGKERVARHEEFEGLGGKVRKKRQLFLKEVRRERGLPADEELLPELRETS